MRANLVPRSLVSAITQTPASGPFGPLTTPPMSVAPTCWALAGVAAKPRHSMIHNSNFIRSSLFRFEPAEAACRKATPPQQPGKGVAAGVNDAAFAQTATGGAAQR